MKWMWIIVLAANCASEDVGFDRAPYYGEDGAPSIESLVLDCGCCAVSGVTIEATVLPGDAAVQVHVFGELDASGEPTVYDLHSSQTNGAQVVIAGVEDAEPPAMLFDRCEALRTQPGAVETWPVRVVATSGGVSTEALLAADLGVFSLP